MTKPPRSSKRGRSLRDDEEWLWREATRGVKTLRKPETSIELLSKSGSQPLSGSAKSPKAVSSAPMAPARRGVAPVSPRLGSGVDGATARRLAQGRITPDAMLDLHGMTQDHAHRALERFLDMSLSYGRRCVLVITGKGGPSKPQDEMDAPWARRRPGVLKSLVPLWLEHSPARSRIASIRTAHIRHGGDGALYVYLRSA
jgi:DNA-nicking Smr family endonuclease